MGGRFLLTLGGSAKQALVRALRREGEAWLPWLIGRFRDSAEPVTDLQSLCAHLERRRLTTLSLLSEHGWDLALVAGADRCDTGQILDATLQALRERGLDEPVRR